MVKRFSIIDGPFFKSKLDFIDQIQALQTVKAISRKEKQRKDSSLVRNHTSNISIPYSKLTCLTRNFTSAAYTSLSSELHKSPQIWSCSPKYPSTSFNVCTKKLSTARQSSCNITVEMKFLSSFVG